jgi:hypothetical protein
VTESFDLGGEQSGFWRQNGWILVMLRHSGSRLDWWPVVRVRSDSFNFRPQVCFDSFLGPAAVRHRASFFFGVHCWPPRSLRNSASRTLSQEYRQRRLIFMKGKMPFAFQDPKVRRETGILARIWASLKNPPSPGGAV